MIKRRGPGRPKGSKNRNPGAVRVKPHIDGIPERKVKGALRFPGVSEEEKRRRCAEIARKGAAARWGKPPPPPKPIEEQYQDAKAEAKANHEPELTVTDFQKLEKAKVDIERGIALKLANEERLRMLIPAQEVEETYNRLIDTVERVLRGLPATIEADETLDEVQAAHARKLVASNLTNIRERLSEGAVYGFDDTGGAAPQGNAPDDHPDGPVEAQA
jgi:hypothetical protein